MEEIDSKRPWGHYDVLADETDYKVKRIIVHAGKRLSLQRHKLRSEHWYVVSGEGEVVLGDARISLTPGEFVDIARGQIHRISNFGSDDLIFIEIQRGDYFGEDDIERIEDDFGRN